MHRKEGALRAQSSARNYRRALIREEELGSLGSRAGLKTDRGPDRRSSEEDVQMANRHTKRCSPPLTRQRQKTATRYHLIPVRTAAVKKTRDDKRGEEVEKRGAADCCWE